MTDDANLSFSMDDFNKAYTNKSKGRGRGPKSISLKLDNVDFSNPYEDVQFSQDRLPTKATNDNFDSFEVPGIQSISFAEGRKQANKAYMDDLLNLVGSKHNRKIKFSPQLATKNGAEWWKDNYHPDYTISDQDLDNDGIKEILIKDGNNDIYAVNGYRLGKGNLSLIQPYYEAYPDKDSRRAAREQGITPRSLAIGRLTKGQKKIDINNPYKIEYVNSAYKESPEYQRMKAAKTLPIIPTKRSAYQVFTTLIVKPVWDAFKQALASDNQLREQYMNTKTINGKTTYSIKDNKKYDLPSPSMAWFAAYAYATHVKDVILQKIANDERIAKDLIAQVLSVVGNLEYRKSMRLPYNKTKYQLYKTAVEKYNQNPNDFSNNIELLQASMEEFFKSSTFKNLAKERVQSFIQPDNRGKVVNALFSELINALSNGDKLYSREQRQRLANGNENINEDNDQTEVIMDDSD